MSFCNQYDPDNVFKRFKVIEFPVLFVGLATEKNLDVEINLVQDAYLKTMCNGSLMKFDEARKISASHRAFQLNQINETTIQITFRPTNECISHIKNNKKGDNKFMFDLRLIQVNGVRCCDNELHSEIGRFYFSGQYEHCRLSHSPKILNFEDVYINTEVTKQVIIENNSDYNATLIESIKTSGFEVFPKKFFISAGSSTCLKIVFKPSCIIMKNELNFIVRNPYDCQKSIGVPNPNKNNNNCILYSISCKSNVMYKRVIKQITIESTHKLNEPDIRYTYVDEFDKITHMSRKKAAQKYLNVFNIPVVKKSKKEHRVKGQCYCDSSLQSPILLRNFCDPVIQRIDTYAIFDILFIPNIIEFGRIACDTYGEKNAVILNNTPYNITIRFQKDDCIFYTNKKLTTFTKKIQAYSKSDITLMCLGYIDGNYQGTFEYDIDNNYCRKQKYSLQVGNPTLRILEKSLKFGMLSSESFVTSVPVRVYNDFNIPIKYKWDDFNAEIPFELIPISGTIPKHCSMISDVHYICQSTKIKTHEINFNSLGYTTKVIPVELNIITRKISVKFLEQAVLFKEIGLNVRTIEKVTLENSSREIASFFVVEPLIPGFTVAPMSGIIQPKMLIAFLFTVQISCVLEFSFDVTLKINNKETITIPVSGNIVEPKVTVYPRNIYMPRIPCGMVTYVPITFKNLGTVKTYIEILDMGDNNVFDIYTIVHGNEIQKIFQLCVDKGQSKTVYIKVVDIFRREYDMYVPFKINGLLGPPHQHNSRSTDLQTYVGQYESQYENNCKVKIRSVSKDISYCRIYGVITVPWILFSIEKFEIDYEPNGSNCIQFTMKNVSNYFLNVTIMTSKLSPAFLLEFYNQEKSSIIIESNITLEMDRATELEFVLKFNPKMNGKFVSTAFLYLDKQMSIPYYNLTFVGRRETPKMTPNTYRILFPPCLVGDTQTRLVTIKMGFSAVVDEFSINLKDAPNLSVKFLKCQTLCTTEGDLFTLLTVEIKVSSGKPHTQELTVSINHECGSSCVIDIAYTFTNCILTMHTHFFVTSQENPYPFFPLNRQKELYEYMTACTLFLEKWMYQQGFRRELYPIIPDTFHVIGTFLSTQSGSIKAKGIKVTLMNFMRRIAGPLIKHFHKQSSVGLDDPFKAVKEIHDTYKQLLHLLQSRGSDLKMLQAKFLLSYDQFVTFTEFVTPSSDADILLTHELLGDVDLFNRLNKQSWIDFILQCYKVFVVESCFFDCVCVSNQSRDIVKIIVDWFNTQIHAQHKNLLQKDVTCLQIKNLTSDLSDGVAIASAILNFCPFLSNHFDTFSIVEDENREASIINNACLIIEAMNLLRLYFPLSSKDFIKPNFLQMLFLSIHLYVVLPMFKPKQEIRFNPPLLRSSARYVGICPTTQESLIFNYILLNNNRNSFTVEKAPPGEIGRKMYLSVKYTAHFVDEEECVLLLHGYNKTRIFDTYMTFVLKGSVGGLSPYKKCKVSGPLYRPNKVEVLVSSPFAVPATFNLHLSEKEPLLPMIFAREQKPTFYVRCLNLIESEIVLTPTHKDTSPETAEQKIYLQLICLSSQVSNTWLWFRSEIGEFFIKITTQPRWDMAMETILAKLDRWPLDPCSCGESCECYRTTVISIPHRNELMMKALRLSLLEFASESMINVFDNLIETETGRLVITRLLEESGTNMSEVKHILRNEVKYRITSKSLTPQLQKVVLFHHKTSTFHLLVTLPTNEKFDKCTITLVSECGMDIRTYRIIFAQSDSKSDISSSTSDNL